MRKLVLAGIAVASLALSGCATVQYASEFSNHPYAQYHAGGKYFRAWPHRNEGQQTILMTGGLGQAMVSGATSGLTMGLVTGNSPYEQWAAGAHWLMDQTPCQLANLRPIDQTTTWAFDYTCPAGFDIRAFMAAHHDDLMHGIAVAR